MFKRFLSLAAIAMIALLVLAACGGDDNGDEDITRVALEGAPTEIVAQVAAATPDGPASPTPEVAVASPAAEAPAVAGALTIEGYDIGWRLPGTTEQLKEFTAAPGDTISLPNVGAAPHNFAVDALAIDVDMPVGETVEVTIPADAAPGAYEYYCSIPGHRPAGMVGTLTIG